MTRRTRTSPSSLVVARVALPLLALGLAACSFSFKAGSKASGEGKPTTGAEPDSPNTAPKPVADADTTPDTTPDTPEEPGAEAPPSRSAGADEPPPAVEPMATAVCRVHDASLLELCHAVMDPIASNDLAAWADQLAEGVVLTRPSHEQGMQRFAGAKEVREGAEAVGGLRALLHLHETDRVVATVSNDCRSCRRSLVAYELNSRSGTIVVSVDLGQPSRIFGVEIDSRVHRRQLEREAFGGSKAVVTTTSKASDEPAADAPAGDAPARTPSLEVKKDKHKRARTPSLEVKKSP